MAFGSAQHSQHAQQDAGHAGTSQPAQPPGRISSTGGRADDLAHRAATVVVRMPLMILVVVGATVALASLHLSSTTVFVDTSFASFYSRQSQVADRQNSEDMNFRGLPGHVPVDQINTDLQRQVETSFANGSDPSAADQSFKRSAGLAGMEDGKQELHVIAMARAPGGDVMAEPHVRALCHMAADTMQAADEWNACHRVMPTEWTEEDWIGCHDDSKCYRAFPCSNAWSVVAMHGALNSLGLAPLLAALARLKGAIARTSELRTAIKAASAVCNSPADAAERLCEETHLHICDADDCQLSASCRIGGIDACLFLQQVHPSAEEIQALASIPENRIDAQGCDHLDMAGLHATLEAASVLVQWKQRFNKLPVADIMGYMVDDTFGHGVQPLTTRVTRMVIKLQAQREGSVDGWEARQQAAKHRSLAFVDHWQAQILPKHQGAGGTQFTYRQFDFFAWSSNRQVLLDARWAAGSLTFLIVYMAVQTGSLCTTLGAVSGILGSLPLSLWLYRFAFGVDWVGILTFLGVFIILGVGADDCFVILEHWKSACRQFNQADSSNLQSQQITRMAWTLRHATSAVTATSVTTMMAFGANCISDIAPVRLFGAFMFILIGVNYLLVITVLPALLICQCQADTVLARAWAWARRQPPLGDEASAGPPFRQFEVTMPCTTAAAAGGQRVTFACCQQGTAVPASQRLGRADTVQAAHLPKLPADRACVHECLTDSVPLPPSDDTRSLAPQQCPGNIRAAGYKLLQPIPLSAPCKAATQLQQGQQGPAEPPAYNVLFGGHAGERASMAGVLSGDDDSHGHEGWMQRFAALYCSSIISLRYVLVLLLAAILVTASILSSRLQFPSGKPSIWKPSNNIRRYWTQEQLFGYGKHLDQVELVIVLGQAPSDHGNLNTPYETGELVLSQGIDFTSRASQMYVLSLCEALEAQTEQGLVAAGSVKCPHLLLDRNLAAFAGQDSAVNSTAGLPVAPSDFGAYMRMYPDLGLASGASRNIAFGTESMRGQTVFDSHTLAYHPDVDPALHDQPAVAERTGWVVASEAGRERRRPHIYANPHATVPLVIRIEARLTLQWGASFTDLRAAQVYWDAWLADHLKDAPQACAPQDAFQTSQAWKLTSTAAAMYDNALLSVALSLGLAFCVLLATTLNAVIALLATLCITAVVVVFTAAMYLHGWTIGVMESICITVLVGMALDYIVHLAHGVSMQGDARCAHTAVTRGLRCMGPSVVSAAITTVGAAAFLLPCEIAAFTRFGTFVCITLSASLVSALVFFPALCAAAGPALHHGRLDRLYAALMRRCDGRAAISEGVALRGCAALPRVSTAGVPSLVSSRGDRLAAVRGCPTGDGQLSGQPQSLEDEGTRGWASVLSRVLHGPRLASEGYELVSPESLQAPGRR